MNDTPSVQELELAVGELDAVDAAILAAIGAHYADVDPMPEGLVERVQFALTLDSLHTEIAELQRLSAGSLSYRGEDADEVQTVTFTSTSLTTMITITPGAAGTIRLDGWIAPGAGVAVELRQEHGTTTTTADEDGRFVFESVPRGMAQFILRSPEAGRVPVVTPSMQL